MHQARRWTVWSVGILVGLGVLGLRNGYTQNLPQPTVFQAAGPNAEAIQSTVDQFRAALGEPNNGNAPGPLTSGRREINWDGGGSTATAVVPTPFEGFLNRGALFTTWGTGFVQATPDGLAQTFNNPDYNSIFQPFSDPRLFSPVANHLTQVLFFVPGDGNVPATTKGFGAVFTDVDRPNGSTPDENRWPSTWVRYFDVNGKLLFSGAVPPSPGDGNLSFFGVVFEEALIAKVLITSGTAAPGPDDDKNHDIVVMDDFLYGEPQSY